MAGPMRPRQLPTPAQGFRAQTATIPAPIGGWNARDSLAAMELTDAVTMMDFWPMTSDVMLRKGYTKQASAINSQVQTLLVYNAPTASKLFSVCASGKIQNCTSAGAASSAVVSGLTTGWMQSVNVGTAGTYFIMAVNGSDPLQYYDGTNWSGDWAQRTIASASWASGKATLHVGSTTGLKVGNVVNVSSVSKAGYNKTAVTVTALTASTLTYAVASTLSAGSGGKVAGPHLVASAVTSNCIGINLWKGFVFLIQKSSMYAWFLPQNSIAGTAKKLDFSGIARRGGYLMAMGTWTLDAGYGADDYAVFLTSQGEVIVYSGTDPSNANTWALIGVWQLGSPIGRRCFLKWAGDILIINYDGVVPLAQGLQSSRLDPRVNLSDKIKNAISTATQSYGGNQGWQLEYYAKANMLLLNVPVTTGASQQQYAMNTITKAWGNFTGFSANCWAIFNDDLYFGGNGYVGKAWNTFSDNSGTITGTCLQAFSQLTAAIESAQVVGGGAQLKRFTMMRPMLQSNGAPAVSGSINVDFDTSQSYSALSFSPVAYGTWDGATWDNGTWGGGLTVQKNWQGAAAVGYWAAPQLRIGSSGIETHWVSTDIVYEKGGVV